jgi:hypothetical protein
MAAKKTVGRRRTKTSRRGAHRGKAVRGRSSKGKAKKAAAKRATKATGGEKTRAQRVADVRKKIVRRSKTPRIATTGPGAALEKLHHVIQAYAAASREMAEWLAAARQSGKSA